MMDLQQSQSFYAWWSGRQRPYTKAEILADGAIHILGLVGAIAAGSILLTFALFETAPEAVPALSIYIGTLVVLLSCSMAFNMYPVSRTKMWLARLDQAAIFLFIAGSYTPFLSVISDTTSGALLMSFVWGASLVGVGLKLVMPRRSSKLAIPLYMAIGWSGILVFQSLAEQLPESTMWLILAGGITYSLGVIFHLWDTLKFQNVLWHVFVVAGASLHLWAVIDCMVVHRL
nr:hemolysin III family protein [uncultured Devosia sp.]